MTDITAQKRAGESLRCNHNELEACVAAHAQAAESSKRIGGAVGSSS